MPGVRGEIIFPGHTLIRVLPVASIAGNIWHSILQSKQCSLGQAFQSRAYCLVTYTSHAKSVREEAQDDRSLGGRLQCRQSLWDDVGE